MSAHDPHEAEPHDEANIREDLTTAALVGAKPGAPARDAETRSFAAPPAQAAGFGDAEPAAPLLPGEETGKLRARWDQVQTGFVDEPRKAVEEADSLVAGAMARLAEVFAAERSRLEGQWDRGGDVSTEDLRQALRRYRSFFARLLSI
ncbi:MAG: hypothetical protein ACYC8V_02780 [Caulobacteraceae bacterium]